MLDEFDDTKKSCRRRLADHNRRRRKPKPNSSVPSSSATPVNTTQAESLEQHNVLHITNAGYIYISEIHFNFSEKKIWSVQFKQFISYNIYLSNITYFLKYIHDFLLQVSTFCERYLKTNKCRDSWMNLCTKNKIPSWDNWFMQGFYLN